MKFQVTITDQDAETLEKYFNDIYGTGYTKTWTWSAALRELISDGLRWNERDALYEVEPGWKHAVRSMEEKRRKDHE